MSILCYLAAGAMNAAWLWLRDELPLRVQLLIPLATVLAAGCGVALQMAGSRDRETRRQIVRRGLWAVLIYYLAVLALLLFFGGLFHMDRAWGGTVNLKPFHTIRNYLLFYRNTGSFVSIMNLLGNVVIMIPLGVLLPLLFRGMRHFWTFLPLAALVSVGVEWVQWITATGAADVDDSILNFLGAFLGYFL